MPSKIRKDRKKRKDYYANRKKAAKAVQSLSVSENHETKTDDDCTGINFTFWKTMKIVFLFFSKL